MESVPAEGEPTKNWVLYKMVYSVNWFGEEISHSKIFYMKRIGSSKKINFGYRGFIGNTLDIHRLIWKSRKEGGSYLQDIVMESIFVAYFK